jgi:hypothetical protein
MGQDTVIIDHEGRLSAVETKIDSLKKNVEDNTKLTREGFEKITDILQGDNGGGHSTRIAVNEQSTKRLWKFVGAGFIALMIGAVKKAFGG